MGGSRTGWILTPCCIISSTQLGRPVSNHLAGSCSTGRNGRAALPSASSKISPRSRGSRPASAARRSNGRLLGAYRSSPAAHQTQGDGSTAGSSAVAMLASPLEFRLISLNPASLSRREACPRLARGSAAGRDLKHHPRARRAGQRETGLTHPHGEVSVTRDDQGGEAVERGGGLAVGGRRTQQTKPVAFWLRLV
eukprot:4208600-Prymnesium_polylepis.1